MRKTLFFVFVFLTPAAALAGDPPAGFQKLFNGTDLSGWKPYKGQVSDWTVRSGILGSESATYALDWLLTEEEFDNFELRLEYRISKGANSGVLLRGPLEGNLAYTGIEVQIQEDSSFNQAPQYYTGTVYGVIPRWGKQWKAIDVWVSMRIILQGRRISVELDDTRVVDNADLDDYLHLSGKYPGLKRDKGYIGLQRNLGKAEFRNVYVKRLPAASGATVMPQIALDSKGHTGPVLGVAFSPDSKHLYSASDDKTVRVWDAANGTPVKVIRPPIREGSVGKLYTVAVSSDGRWLATGGFDSFVYVIDLPGGKLKHVLRGHNGTIHGLAFSPDSTLLASGANDQVAALWDVETGKNVKALRGHKGQVRGLAFSPDGSKLATSSADGTARIWQTKDGNLSATLTGHNKPLAAIAWSADGKTIATADLNGIIRLWNNDGQHRGTVDTKTGLYTSLCFTPDSSELLFAALTTVGKLDIASGNVGSTAKSHNDLYCIAVSPDGKLCATGGVLAADLRIRDAGTMRELFRLRGQATPRFSAAWGPTGKTIAWGETYLGPVTKLNDVGPLEHAFDVGELELIQPNERFVRRNASYGDLSVVPESATKLQVRSKANTIATLDATDLGGTFRAAVPLDRERVVVGSRFGHTYVVDVNTGKSLRYLRGHLAGVWAIEPSPDGKYLLTASEDETLRVWTLDRSDPILSLFFARNDWVAWTPEGYYAASPGGERLMGWHVNNGPDKLATFYPASQFRQSLYRPDVIRRLLEAGNVDKALALADKAVGKTVPSVQVADVLPPLVVITSPDQPQFTLAEPTLEVRALAKSSSQAPVSALRLFVNGRPYPGADGLKPIAKTQQAAVRESWKIQLPPGKHTVAVQAESAVSKALSDPVEVTYEGTRGIARPDKEKKIEELELPSLYVLAVGISEYSGDLKLNYAAKDAQVLAKTLAATSDKLYRKVEVKVLTDKEATRRAVLQGLTWLRKQVTQRDVAVVFFAGHGDKDADGKFYLLPIDVDKDDLISSAVPGEQVKSVLAGLPGRVMVLLDACHSGAVDGEKKRSRGALTDDLVRDLATDDYGVVVMCSSMGREFSIESPTVEHGFFTLAIVEGLTGKADYNKDRVIHLNELDLYVTDRVKTLSQGRQHPVTTRPTSIRSFPLSQTASP